MDVFRGFIFDISVQCPWNTKLASSIRCHTLWGLPAESQPLLNKPTAIFKNEAINFFPLLKKSWDFSSLRLNFIILRHSIPRAHTEAGLNKTHKSGANVTKSICKTWKSVVSSSRFKLTDFQNKCPTITLVDLLKEYNPVCFIAAQEFPVRNEVCKFRCIHF